MTALEVDRADVKAWVYVAGMCQDYGFDPELRTRLGDLLADTDLAGLSSGPGEYRFSLAVMQNFVAVFQEERIGRRLEAQLLLLAASSRSADRSEDQRRRDRASFLEAAYVLAAAEPTVPRAVETFARVLDRLCDVDPLFHDGIAPLVRRLWRWLPGQALVRLVPLLLRVRRDAGWEDSAESASNDQDGEALDR